DPPLPTLAPPGNAGIAGAPATQSINVDTPLTLPSAPAPSAADERTVTIIEPGAAAAAPPALALAPQPGALVVEQPQPSIRPQTPTIDSAESEAAYREAFKLLKAGQYEESIAGFNAYLEQYPASQYADNAQYWLGEAEYVMRRFDAAIGEYQKLIDRYPNSKKRSHAMLKIAYSYDELGMTDQAVGVLGDLKTRFAGSAAARLADERLERIRAAAAP
ncbi:MAG: tol-pal system protein YbgF, partial [Gammaproteobacteria bacterium]